MTQPGDKKLCPFDASSAVCSSAECYFYFPDANNGRMCPSMPCDDLITEYCRNQLVIGRSDYGCKVLTRPPFYSAEIVGSGPYIDWLEDSPHSEFYWMPSESRPVLSQAPLQYVVKPGMRGGMASKQFTIQLQSSSFTMAVQTALIDDIATTLGTSTALVYLSSHSTAGSTTQAIVQVVGGITLGEDDPTTSWTAKIASLKGKTTLGNLPMISIVDTDEVRTNLCYGDNPIAGCVDDPTWQALKPSRELMSGVNSVTPADLETCPALSCSPLPDVILVGIQICVVVCLTFVIAHMGVPSGIPGEK